MKIIYTLFFEERENWHVDTFQILCCWYVLASMAFLYYYLGILGALCALLQPSLLHMLTFTRSKSTTWFIYISFLFIIHVLKIPDGAFQTWLGFSDEQHYILTLMMCWIHLRSISHNMDSPDGRLCDTNSFIQRLAYCLYLPTLFLGPLILYHEFVESVRTTHSYVACSIWIIFDKKFDKILRFIFQITQPRQYRKVSFSLQKLQVFALNLTRYTFWLYFTEFLLHFIYINAVQYHPQVIIYSHIRRTLAHLYKYS